MKDVKNGKAIWAHALEEVVFHALGKYIDGLKLIGAEPPLIVMLTLEGVYGAYYRIPGASYDFDDILPTIDRTVLNLPECLIEDSGTQTDYHRAVKPAFDALWNTVGYLESQFFSKETGMWIGPRTI